MNRLIACLLALILAAPALAEVEIQDITTPGGIDAWLVEEHQLPFTALEIRFRGGTALDPEGARGVTNLMTGLLEEGAGDLDSRAFAARAEALATSLRFRAYDDAISVSARFLTENRDEALDLLKLALTEPTFPEDAIERVKAQVLSSLRSRQTDPDSIAGETFNRLAYGDHPYGSDDSGTAESVTALTREDIVAAYDTVITRDDIYVSAVGDITADELGAILDDLLGDLPEGGTTPPGAVEFGIEEPLTVVPFDTPQATVYFGHPGVSVDDPDFITAYVLNTIMGGGGFNSRLMDELREQRGLTYGVGTYLVDRDFSDALVGSFKSDNARVAEAVDLVRAEWADMATKGPTQEELDAAKTYLTGSYPLRFDGNGTIAGILVGMQMNGYPTSYVDTRNDRIEEITLEEARRVASELYQPDALSVVVVGQPEGLPAGE